MLYLETKFASLVSYGLTVGLMGELLPLDRPIGVERVRRHLFQVAEAHEAELAAAPTRISPADWTGPPSAPPDGPLFVGIDGSYVRGRDQDWFEVIAGKSVVSFHRDGRVPDPSGRCFAFVQTVDDKARARLVDTLHEQGMQPQQQVVFLSDGADTLRRLQQNIAPEAEHVLDWFHVAMRLTVLGQMIKGAWTEAAIVEAKAAALERIKWLLWHGNVPDALDDIECLADDVAVELQDNPTSTSLRKLAAALGEFATYIANNTGHIVNYGERFRAGERISTGFVESAINQIVDKRFDKRQSMRWTPRGAHLLLQTRTRVINGDLDQLVRRRYPAFRKSAATATAPVCDGLDYPAQDYGQLFEHTRRERVGVVGIRVLAGGALSGSALRHPVASPEPEPIGSALSYKADLSRASRLMPLVTEGFAASLAEAAIRFAIAHPAIGTILVGMASVDEFEAAVAAVQKGPLPAPALQRVAELTECFSGDSR